jgi:hypothetical protein
MTLLTPEGGDRPDRAITVNCVRCGYPLPPLTGSDKRLFLGGGGAVAQHAPGQCPPEQAAAQAAPKPVERTFQAHMVVVELVDNPDAPGDKRPAPGPPIADFQVTVTAPSAHALMEPGGPLADAVGAKWARVAQYANLADIPVVTGEQP